MDLMILLALAVAFLALWRSYELKDRVQILEAKHERLVERREAAPKPIYVPDAVLPFSSPPPTPAPMIPEPGVRYHSLR
jgi:hypothetical protein